MNGASIYFDRFFFSSIAHLKNNILKIPQKPIAGWWDERGLKFELKSCPVIWKIWIWLLTANCVIRRSRRMCFFRIYFDVVGQQKKIFGEKNMKRFLGLHDHFSIVTIILSWWWCSSNMGWNLKKGGILGRHILGIIIFCMWTFDVLKDIIVWKKDLLKTKWNLLTLYSKKKKERRN